MMLGGVCCSIGCYCWVWMLRLFDGLGVEYFHVNNLPLNVNNLSSPQLNTPDHKIGYQQLKIGISKMRVDVHVNNYVNNYIDVNNYRVGWCWVDGLLD